MSCDLDILDEIVFLTSKDDAKDIELEITVDYVSGGSSSPVDESFQTIAFANPLNIDASSHKNWICAQITGNTTINLNNTKNGDSGQIKVAMDNVGGYTVHLGEMFTKKYGSDIINVTANKISIITWSNDGTDINYVISST